MRGVQGQQPASLALTVTFGHRTVRVPRILNSNLAFQVLLKVNLSKKDKTFCVMMCYLDFELFNI